MVARSLTMIATLPDVIGTMLPMIPITPGEVAEAFYRVFQPYFVCSSFAAGGAFLV
jgi:hypothetical protein